MSDAFGNSSTVLEMNGQAAAPTATSESTAPSGSSKSRRRHRKKTSEGSDSKALRLDQASLVPVVAALSEQCICNTEEVVSMSSGKKENSSQVKGGHALSKEEQKRRSEEGRRRKAAASIHQQQQVSKNGQVQSTSQDTELELISSDLSLSEASGSKLKPSAPEFVPRNPLGGQNFSAMNAQLLDEKKIAKQKLRRHVLDSNISDRASLNALASSSEMCLVCADEMVYATIGACQHPICSICALRIRFKSKDKSCVVCKAHMESMLVYEASTIETGDAAHIHTSISGSVNPGNKSSSYFEIFLTLFKSKNIYVGIVFDPVCGLYFYNCSQHSRQLQNMRSTKCPSCSESFPTQKKLLAHLQSSHKLFMCELCVENRTVFLSEQVVYSKAELEVHLRKSGAHVQCGFCQVHCYDYGFLYSHMRDKHVTCHHCPKMFQFRYYRDPSSLLEHVHISHYCCSMCNSLDASFSNHSHYANHMISMHNRSAHGGQLDFGRFAATSKKQSSSSAFSYVDLQPVDDEPSITSAFSTNRDPVAGRVTGAGNIRRDREDVEHERYFEGLHRSEMLEQAGGAALQTSFPSLSEMSSLLASSSVEMQSSKPEKHKLHISNLPPETFEDPTRFSSILSDLGLLRGPLRLPMDKKSGTFRGYAIVEFPSKELAENVSCILTGYDVDGYKLSAEYVPPCVSANIEPTENPLVVQARKQREERLLAAKRESEKRSATQEQLKLRNDKLAVALGVEYREYQSTATELEDLEAPCASYYVTIYPPELTDWARANTMELIKVERKLFDLIQDKQATSVNCKPMPKKARNILHGLASFYGVSSFEYDPEPQRYVSFVKLLDSKLPSNLLSQRCRAVSFLYN
jgi:hypothetical protein